MDSEEPYLIEQEGRIIVELPVDWRLDDWPYLEYHRSLTPTQLLETWVAEMEEARRRRGYLSLTMHPQCVARGARIRILEEILRHAARTNAYMARGDELAGIIAAGERGG